MSNAEQPAAERLEGLEPLIAMVQQLAESAARRLCIRAVVLDGRLWEHSEVISALREFATARSYRELRFLIERPEDLPRENPQLVALAQRLPTIVQLRTPDPDSGGSAPGHTSYCVNDAAGVLVFDADGHLGGDAEPAHAGRARFLEQRFETEWERARPLTELRVLGI